MKRYSKDTLSVRVDESIGIEATVSTSRLFKNQDYINKLVNQITNDLGGTEDKRFSNLSYIMEGWPVLVELGSELVPLLLDAARNKNPTSQTLITQLLGDIAQDTKDKFGYQPSHFLCECCFAKYTTYNANLSWINTEFTFYGCRICGQSRKYINHKGIVVAILDNQMKQIYSIQNDRLNVNWILHRAMFDFEEIEIVRATDEDTERFVVQLGNDTDELRCPHYKQMSCSISSDCELTKNTLRILTRTFENTKATTLAK